MTRTRTKTILLITLFTLLASASMFGCLSESYVIPDSELARVAKLPVEKRGKTVRVVQRWASDAEPSEEATSRRQDYDSNASFDVGTHVSFRLSHHHHSHWNQSWRPVHVHRSVNPIGAPRTATAPPPRGASQPATVNPTSSSGGSSLNVDGDQALVALVVLVATEGMRYDGWMQLDRDQPIHLMRDDGSEEVVYLSELGPQHIGLGDAVITENEGGTYRVQRAPLWREGAAWRMEVGGMQVPTPDGEFPTSLGVSMGLGYFPLQQLGFLLTSSFAWGEQAGGDFLGIQYGLEADFIPLQLWRLHAGIYGIGGMGFYEAEGGQLPTESFHEPVLEVGGIGEFDLTTRLAFQGKVGVRFQQHDSEFLPAMWLITGGLSVY